MARLTWRWGLVAALVASLSALPTLAGALPADRTDASAEQLLARVKASGSVGWSGYGESRGALVLPDVDELSALPALFGGTTRARAWWRGPQDWRVDALTPVGEVDTTSDEQGGWTWSSADRQATRLSGALDVRLPAAADLLAPTLGRRLAGTSDVVTSRLPARRVAGRSAAGLRLVPRQPDTTTVGSVEMWVEPGTGLPLRVEVFTAGQPDPVVQTSLLDLDLRPPPAERTRFVPPREATVTVVDAPDLAALADRFAPYRLPDELVGLPRRPRSTLSVGGGVGTYGDGFTALALVPLPHELGHNIIRRVGSDPEASFATISTSLVNALVGVDRGGRAYLLAGTVPMSLLTTALERLRADPPPGGGG
ncbi:MAG: hypothetical protein ACR2K2_14465 [Mycobacteriales bacterium]